MFSLYPPHPPEEDKKWESDYQSFRQAENWCIVFLIIAEVEGKKIK